jgi:hypothetical protein
VAVACCFICGMRAVLQAAVKLSRTYIADRFLPDKVRRLLQLSQLASVDVCTLVHDNQAAPRMVDKP